MATKPDDPALVMLELYGETLAFPAHLASTLLPHLLHIERKYEDGEYVTYLHKTKLKFELMSADEHTAMKVRTILRNKNEGEAT